MPGTTLSCRSCGNTQLQRALSLGEIPLSGALRAEERQAEPEPKYPLEALFCPQCSLVQLAQTAPPASLACKPPCFHSFSDLLVEHARHLAARLIEARRLNAGSLVVEIGSNDGYLLRRYHQQGVPVLGIEPCVPLARVARDQYGIRTLAESFSSDLACQLSPHGRADILHAHNVVSQCMDLNGFASGARILLKEKGVAIIEVPYIKDLIDRSEFAAFQHEHVCYFSLTALDALFARHRLRIQRAERIPLHGGSLRLVIGHENGARLPVRVTRLLEQERAWGLDRLEYYTEFARRVEGAGESLYRLLHRLKQQGKRIAAYGAAPKGVTLLNYARIGDALDFIADGSAVKQGRYLPGVRLPIQSPDRLLETMPHYCLLLAGNADDEAFRQQAEYRRRGGQFIVPIPQARIV